MKKHYNQPNVAIMQLSADMHLCAGSSTVKVTGTIVTGGNAPLNPGSGL